jgi:hypothetical protein
MSTDPITVEELPACLVELNERMSAVEADLQFMKNLWVLSAYGVCLPRGAPRDPRVLARRRPRQKGHL